MRETYEDPLQLRVAGNQERPENEKATGVAAYCSPNIQETHVRIERNGF